jgi:cytosine/adenosine deaminase-related metal-dependent hydrolase
MTSQLEPNQTPGLVCAHHHLYSALARGMPAPPRTPARFIDILELVWWRLDRALDEDTIYWSAKLGALEALQRGCTAIVDHHESPNAIDGSLSIIADACAEVGVRVNCAYGVTDRHGPEGAAKGLAENDRFLREGGRGMVGIHAAFTCSDDTLAAAAELAVRHNVGVHVHVAEGNEDTWQRLVEYSSTNWWLIHGVHLPDDHGLLGTMVHNPRSNMNNGVPYAEPRRFVNPIGLGTDGIGADMLDEFRVAFVAARATDVQVAPDLVWDWLRPGWELIPEALDDVVSWDYAPMDPWRLAYSPGVSPTEVRVDDEVVWADGAPTRVDGHEVRAKAAEAASKLFERLSSIV